MPRWLAITAISALLLAPPKPQVRITGPHMVLRALGAPTEVLIRVKFIDPPECFGVGISWGDGEVSAWQTCDETSWSKPHKYRTAGELVIAVTMWSEESKVLARDEHRLTISD